MKRAAALALAVIFALTLTGCGARGDNLARKGAADFSAGRYESALENLNKALDSGLKNFNEAYLYWNIGGVKYKLGDIDGSIEAYRKALEISPARFDCLRDLGAVYYESGDKENALLVCEAALAYDPEDKNSIVLYINLGRLYIENNKAFSAVKYLEKARNVSGDEDTAPVVYALLSIAYAMDMQYEKSDQAFDIAVLRGYRHIDAVKEQIERVKERYNYIS